VVLVAAVNPYGHTMVLFAAVNPYGHTMVLVAAVNPYGHTMVLVAAVNPQAIQRLLSLQCTHTIVTPFKLGHTTESIRIAPRIDTDPSDFLG
jgi:AmiR/NasT family two-component response regulator